MKKRKTLLALLLSLVMLLGMLPTGIWAEEGASDGSSQTENQVPVLVEGVTDRTVTIQTGLSYQLDDLMNGKIFTDPDGTSLTYANYFYQKSTDGGATWGERTGFQAGLYGGVEKSLTNSVAGTYMYRFVANDGQGDSTDTWTLTLIVQDVVRENINFYLSQDQNYSTTSQYPSLELYKTAGLDQNNYDYVGWFTNGEGQTEYVYNPHDYTIEDGDTDYVVVGENKYELHDYEKISFTNSAFDDTDTSATASGTVVNKYNMFYASLETGRYSTRGYGWNADTEAYDVYLGGQSLKLPMEKDIYGGGGNDIYLTLLACYASNRKTDNTYFTAEEYHIEMDMPVTGSRVHSGTAFNYLRYGTTYAAYPFLIYAAGNASLYNLYLYPEDTDTYILTQQSNLYTNKSSSMASRGIAMAKAALMSMTVPENAEFHIYFQYNNFNTKSVEPVGDAVVNGDGTKTLSYKISQGSNNYTWRLTDPSGTYVTKAGWMPNVSKDTSLNIGFDEDSAKDQKTHDSSALGTAVSSRDEADLQVYLSHSGFLSTSDTKRIRAFRMWQVINSDTANIMVEPDFNFQVLQGSAGDISQVNGGNAGGNWIDVTPSGTDIVAVNYNAIDLYRYWNGSFDYGTHGGLFPATAPERTGVFVITNEAAGSADAQIRFNGSQETSRGTEWDYNYDTWYYNSQDAAPVLDFKVNASGDVKVSYAVVTTDAALNSTLSGWTELTMDETGSYAADLLPFRRAGTAGGTVIIKMTDATGTSYRLVRVAEMTVTVKNASNEGEAIQPGDKVTLTFDGLYRGVDKSSGIFNPTTLQLKYSAGETEFSGSLGQYQQMDRVSITVTIPEDLEFPEGETSRKYTIDNGYIYGAMYSASSPYDTMYNMTDIGVGTNFSAVSITFAESRLADVTLDVESKVYYKVKLDPVSEGQPVTDVALVLKDQDGNSKTAEEDGTYQLGYGTYNYTITKAGYVRVIGSFTLGSADAADLVDGLLIKTIEMTRVAENAWDGTTVTEPAVDDNGIYQIGTGAELAWFAQAVNGGTGDSQLSAVLTRDIDLASYEWTPIGNASRRFAGSFDGQGYRIFNLSINYAEASTYAPYQGLFGCVVGSSDSARASIQNLTVQGTVNLTSLKSTSSARSAGVVGYAMNLNLTNVHSEVNVMLNRVAGNWDSIGGIVGYMENCNLTNCSNSGSVQGWRYVGGLVGNASSNCILQACCNTGRVTAPSAYGAGLAGYLGFGSRATQCYNTGLITVGEDYAAGLVAHLGQAEVSNCFNAGALANSNTMICGSAFGTVSVADAVIRNVYYLEGTCDKGGIGSVKNAETQKVEAVSAETLASAEFVTTMNTDLEEKAFVRGTAYPILTWQGSGSEDPDVPTVKGYRVSLGEGTSAGMGQEVTASLVVSHETETSYNAYAYEISYDADKLTYKGLNLADATVKQDEEKGLLTITGYGPDKTCGTDNLVITFLGKAAGDAQVTITKANIDKADNADAQNAPEAAIDQASATLKITGYTVSLSEDFSGASHVDPGADYTFTARDTHYDYQIHATMGGAATEVVDNGDGSYTIKNVTGDLVITDTRTPKTYSVTVTGDGASDATAGAWATYQTPYRFSVAKDDKYTYEVTATIADAPYSLTQAEDGTYTIPGADVIGAIVITIAKEKIPLVITEISFTGSGSADVEGGTTQTADNGVDFSFRLNAATGYEYKVTLDGQELTADAGGNYAIPGSKLTGEALTVVVEKTAKSDIQAEVHTYLKLNGKTMWLITATGTLADGKVLAYDGTAMFWSDKYGAYAYLLISDQTEAAVKEEAAAKVAEATADKTSVTYDYDINGTGKVDINDAQLTYNMYNAAYDSFEVTSMLKFLKADVNGDRTVSVLDSAAIVNQILG